MTHKKLIVFMILTISPFAFTQTLTTGPELPRPNLQPVSESKATIKTTITRDPILEKDVSKHTIIIEDNAALQLFSSLTAAPKTGTPGIDLDQETRTGRNIQCNSKIYLEARKPVQKFSCEMTVTDGEYVDLSLAQNAEVNNGQLQLIKTSPATAKVQTRLDGIHVTLTGVLPKSPGVSEIFKSLIATEDDSKSSGTMIKTKNMMTCSRDLTKRPPTATCTTVFKNGVALIPTEK